METVLGPSPDILTSLETEDTSEGYAYEGNSFRDVLASKPQGEAFDGDNGTGK
jgi:hypothetical protein